VKIELGKKYLTECGLVAYVTCQSNGGTYPFHGDIRSISIEACWTVSGKRNATCIKHPFDLVRELTPEDDLAEQTIDTFAKLVRNGGKVPDGFVMECNAVGNPADLGWNNDNITVGMYPKELHYRLTPIPQPPRFSVSTDPIGVLDAQQPGMVAKFWNGLDSAQYVADMLNRCERQADKYEWKPISSPKTAPLDRDDFIGHTVWLKVGVATELVQSVFEDRIKLGHKTMTYADLVANQIERNVDGEEDDCGQLVWRKCEKSLP